MAGAVKVSERLMVPGYARVVVLPRLHEIEPSRGYLEQGDFGLVNEVCEIEAPDVGNEVHHRCRDHDVVICWRLT